jgi:hypothetical protein
LAGQTGYKRGGIPMSHKQEAHELLDRLAPDQLVAVLNLLRVMTLDPAARAIANASTDDKPESEQERRAVAEAGEWRKQNRPIPFEEALADFGLTVEDVRNYKEPV